MIDEKNIVIKLMQFVYIYISFDVPIIKLIQWLWYELRMWSMINVINIIVKHYVGFDWYV